MKNLNVNQKDFEDSIEYPIKQAPGWGTELRGPAQTLHYRPGLSRDWLVDCQRPERDLYVAYPKSLSGKDYEALAGLQAQNNHSDVPRNMSLHSTLGNGDSGLLHDGNWVTVTAEGDRLRVAIEFIPRYKSEI